jgi:Flp pilus assembly protein TadD
LLGGRAKLARKEFEEARNTFTQAAERNPQDVRPGQLLSHTYLQVGRNWHAAERALRAVLALDPEHHETRRNLAVLLEPGLLKA